MCLQYSPLPVFTQAQILAHAITTSFRFQREWRIKGTLFGITYCLHLYVKKRIIPLHTQIY